MATSLLPTPDSPWISTPSPYTSIITPEQVIWGARCRRRLPMRVLVNTEVVSWVRRTVRSYFSAISMHSGNGSMPRVMMSPGTG